MNDPLSPVAIRCTAADDSMPLDGPEKHPLYSLDDRRWRLCCREVLVILPRFSGRCWL